MDHSKSLHGLSPENFRVVLITNRARGLSVTHLSIGVVMRQVLDVPPQSCHVHLHFDRLTFSSSIEIFVWKRETKIGWFAIVALLRRAIGKQ
jgi:hypothetical protein